MILIKKYDCMLFKYVILFTEFIILLSFIFFIIITTTNKDMSTTMPPLIDEYDDVPFKMTKRRQEIISIIGKTYTDGKPLRLQIIVPRRRYGKSRLMREIQRNPDMIPGTFEKNTRIAIVVWGRVKEKMWPNHININSIGTTLRDGPPPPLDIDRFKDYDAIIFDDCVFRHHDGAYLISRLAKELHDIPMISICSYMIDLPGFVMWQSTEEMNERGWGIIN